jgi:hypothetical protein
MEDCWAWSKIHQETATLELKEKSSDYLGTAASILDSGAACAQARQAEKKRVGWIVGRSVRTLIGKLACDRFCMIQDTTSL